MSDDRPTLTLPIDVETPTEFTMVLRQNWMTAEADGIKATLDCGAGVGSPHLVLAVERDGEVIAREIIDFRGPLESWIDAAIKRADNR